MLKTRIIPTLLIKGFGLAKGTNFNNWRRVGAVLPAIKIYNQRDVDELIISDILASQNNEEPDYESIKDFCSDCFVPLTFGGGIRNIEHVQKLLDIGIDKVSINSSLYENPKIMSDIANKFGSQSIVASIDVKKSNDKGWDCYSHSGTIKTTKNLKSWVKELEERGCGEILITSIDNDGTMKGYDLKLIKYITSIVNIPVIASGGAGNFEHMSDAILKSDASAVAAGSIFQFTEQTPIEIKNQLSLNGISVRNPINMTNL